jgi:hypothetical protein
MICFVLFEFENENLLNRIAQQDKFNRSSSVDLLLNEKNLRRKFQSTDSTLYSMSDQNFTIIKDFFYYFKSKILTNKTNSNPSRKFSLFFFYLRTKRKQIFVFQLI